MRSISQPSKPLRVVAWPRSSPSNAYTGSLNDALERNGGVTVSEFHYSNGALLRAMMNGADIIHMHWLERPFWAQSRRLAVRQAIYALAVMAALKARGGSLIWTAHDPQPHHSPINEWLFSGWTRPVWQCYRRLLLRMIDGVLLLSESHRDLVVANAPTLAAIPKAVVPHPHYRGQYPDDVNKDAARTRLGIPQDKLVFAFVGSLRAYKNPEGLMEAFNRFQGNAMLVVVGGTENSEQSQRLQTLADKDPRIRFHDQFVADDDLQYWLRAADVMVLPYRKVTNSGSAHLALSFDLPVLVPDEPVFQELEMLVGAEWVRRFPAMLSADHLAEAIGWIKEARPPRPDLSALDWDTIANRTIDFYRKMAP